MSAPLTPERLAEYAALEQAATKGPWLAIIDPADDGFPQGAIGVAVEDETFPESVFVFSGSVTDGVEILRADAEFVAAARTAVPDLLAAVTRLTADLDATAAALYSNRERRIRAEILREAADELVAFCPNHGNRDTSFIDCHCPAADDLRRTADGGA